MTLTKSELENGLLLAATSLRELIDEEASLPEESDERWLSLAHQAGYVAALKDLLGERRANAVVQAANQ